MELIFMIGKVREIFVPNDDLDMIGFKVQLDDEIIEIIQKQNQDNCKIYREDKVFISYNDDLIEIKKMNDEE